ncbi:MAG: Rossmann-like and DUF2520 domain-containing protein [Actinomycetota bacterium]
MKISVIGAGRTGTALAVLWQAAGHGIVAVSGREATRERAARFLPIVPVMAAPEAARRGEVVVLGVPDDAISPVCDGLAERGALTEGQTVMHLSGATGLDALAAARGAGASLLSLHPLLTFPDVESALRRIPDCGMALTAEVGADATLALGERLAVDAGGRPFRLPDEVKGLYHAAAVFASNYLIAVTAEAENLFKAAGLPDPKELFMPLARASFENAMAVGPEAALTGPAARGDAGTVARNLEALADRAPDAIPAYVALARVALDLAQHADRVTDPQRAAVEEVLARWT